MDVYAKRTKKRAFPANRGTLRFLTIRNYSIVWYKQADQVASIRCEPIHQPIGRRYRVYSL